MLRYSFSVSSALGNLAGGGVEGDILTTSLVGCSMGKYGRRRCAPHCVRDNLDKQTRAFSRSRSLSTTIVPIILHL